MKAKALAKAKVAPAFAPAPIPEVVAGPQPAEAHPIPAVEAAPPAPGPRGHYEYVSFAGGHIAFSETLRYINAHCLHLDHQTSKCHMVWVLSVEASYGRMWDWNRPSHWSSGSYMWGWSRPPHSVLNFASYIWDSRCGFHDK